VSATGRPRDAAQDMLRSVGHGVTVPVGGPSGAGSAGGDLPVRCWWVWSVEVGNFQFLNSMSLNFDLPLYLL
jgi:hypothetical protein